jgi:hypothetical protein
MDIKSLRALIEMAYLHAWGPRGSADARYEFRIAYLAIQTDFPHVGDFLFQGEGFLWKPWKGKRAK